MSTIPATDEDGGIVPEWTFGERVKKARKVADIHSAEELAERLDMSRNGVGGWETDTSLPTFRKLCALARETGVSVRWLAGNDYTDNGQPIRSRCFTQQIPGLDWRSTLVNVHVLAPRDDALDMAHSARRTA